MALFMRPSLSKHSYAIKISNKKTFTTQSVHALEPPPLQHERGRTWKQKYTLNARRNTSKGRASTVAR